jgi:uncharacterized membrane protein
MNRRRVAGLSTLVVAALVVAVRFGAPDQYDAAVSEGQQVVGDAPEPAIVAAVWLIVVAVWLVAMYYAAKALYWGWRQIDTYVLKVADLLLPESPVVRFGVGLIFMVLVFLIGPLIVLQALDYFEDDQDPINESAAEDNDDTDNNEDGGTNNENDSPNESDEPSDGSTEGDPTNDSSDDNTTAGELGVTG